MDKKVKKLFEEIQTEMYKRDVYINDLVWTLTRILDSLPHDKDWLDPDLEKYAKELVDTYYNEM
jgi:hypothetical protein